MVEDGAVEGPLKEPARRELPGTGSGFQDFPGGVDAFGAGRVAGQALETGAEGFPVARAGGERPFGNAVDHVQATAGGEGLHRLRPVGHVDLLESLRQPGDGDLVGETEGPVDGVHEEAADTGFDGHAASDDHEAQG